MTNQPKGKSLVATIIIVVALIAIGVGIYLIDQSRTNENSNSNTNNNTNTAVVTKIDDSQATPAMVEEVVAGINDFTFDLYAKLQEEEGNLFFSPYSISTCLAMTYEGAEGQTATEMQKVFNFPTDDTTRQAGYASIYNEINKEDKEYTLSTANALWAQLDFTFLDKYFDLVGKYYGGRVTNLDFIDDTENSRVTINDWVEDQTNGKITDLIARGAVGPATRLVLTNAIYFYGEWLKEFQEEDTEDDDFRLTPENTIQIPMMKKTGTSFNYAENDQLELLELPYKGEELSMIFLLPQNDDLSGLQETLSDEQLIAWKDDLFKQKVNIYIPKFKFEKSISLTNTLKEMGMPTAFNRVFADFSQMSEEEPLMITDVVHKAFVEVNEKGTEAAAATGTTIGIATSVEPPTPVFRADHPFLFLIQQTDTGNILFLGRVSDPR
ncbi:MAG: serpin family protein [Patescibacteria group bacterium]